MNKTHYLSIVVAVRNDNHGGDFIKRFQNCLNSLFYLNSKYPFELEIIVVEWNTPDYKPSIAKCVDLKLKPYTTTVRFISVPPSVHKRYKYWDKLPLYQMIAKNVGIRRAKGEFILCTNADIIFSEELFKFFSEKRLKMGCIYRTLRVDVDNKELNFDSYSHLIGYCKNNIIRVNGYTSHKNINELKDESFWIGILNNLNRYNLFRDMEEKLVSEFLFTNACGDFQLMHRSHWFDLRGYPEFDKYSFHIDSILEYQAFYSGLKEKILTDNHCIYHIEHTSGFIPEKKKEFEEKYPQGFRISDRELDFFRIAVKYNQGKKIFNDKNWGLIEEKSITELPVNFPKITFVAVPREFEGEFETIQYNAILSWLNLSINPEVVLLTDEDFKIPSHLLKNGIRFIKKLRYTKYNKPSLRSVFEAITENIKTDYVVYVNCDIVFLDNFPKSINRIVEEVKNRSFIVGKRRNIELKDKIDFDYIHWWDEIYRYYISGNDDTNLSIDYFVFHKRFLEGDIPDFSIGGMYWDNWLIYKAFKDRLIPVDASNSIIAIHQNHTYTANQTVKDILKSEMAQNNFELMGGNINKKHIGHLEIKFSDGRFISNIGEDIDIKEIISLHENNFEKLDECSFFSRKYVSGFLGISNNGRLDIEIFLVNLYNYMENPDLLFSLSFTIIRSKNKKFFHIFPPLMQRVSEFSYLNGDNLIGLKYTCNTDLHIDYWKNKDDPIRYLVLGLIYYYGLGCKKYEEKGLEYIFQYYIENEDTFNKLLFFRLFFDAKKEPYMTRYLQYFENDSSPESYYFLGMTYCRGLGYFIEESEDKAKEYFLKAAEHGLKEGINYLGIRYIMDKDIKKGFSCFEIGNKVGDELSKKNLKYIMDKLND